MACWKTHPLVRWSSSYNPPLIGNVQLPHLITEVCVINGRMTLTVESIVISPPARWGLLDFIRVVLLLLRLLLLRLLRQFLLDHVCINFHLHFRLANSSPSSSPTSELSAHCWTSTWDLPSSVRTAGPQPGTFPAQCALLDLNLRPSQLSAHR